VVELGGEELQFLIRWEWLDERAVGDRASVGSAISRMLADAARR
jgi:hypothetical protein